MKARLLRSTPHSPPKEECQRKFKIILEFCADGLLSELSGEAGVSGTTLGEWLSILESSFIVFRRHPYFANIGKRVIKSTKLYFSEVGLAAYLLGIENPAQVTRDPLPDVHGVRCVNYGSAHALLTTDR